MIKSQQNSNNPCTGLEAESVDQYLVPSRVENPINKKRKWDIKALSCHPPPLIYPFSPL